MWQQQQMQGSHLSYGGMQAIASAMAGGYVTREQQAAVHAALDGNPKAALFDYQGQNHAFARVGGVHYDKASADLALERTLGFFKENLG